MKINTNNRTSNFSCNSFTHYTATMKALYRKVTRKNITLTTQKVVRGSMGRFTEGYTWRRRKGVRRLIKSGRSQNPLRALISVQQASRFYQCYSSLKSDAPCFSGWSFQLLQLNLMASYSQNQKAPFLTLYLLVQTKGSLSLPGTHPCPAQPLWWCRSAGQCERKIIQCRG